MAFIGMRHVVAAKISSHTDGTEPTYAAGKVVGKAISGNLTINRNTNPLYADDVIAEDDNSITSMELELGLDDLLEDVQAYMGLLTEKTTGSGTSAVTMYYETTKASNAIGIGYIRVRRKNNATTYQAVWVYKALFSKNSESSATKGESIEWQTPTVTGRCMGLVVETDQGDPVFRKIQNFDTEAAAETWLDGMAEITPPGP